MVKLKKTLLFAPWAATNQKYFSYQAWFEPLSEIFETVIVFDPQKETYTNGKDQMNRNFLELIRKNKPDYVYLWLIYEEFYFETIKRIKEVSPNTKVINFFGDDDILFESFSNYYSRFMDYSLASHLKYFHRYKEEGIKNVFFSCGVNTTTFNYTKSKKIYDVTFIGTPMPERVESLKYLIENGIKVRIYGKGWDKFPELKHHYFGAPTTEEATRIINQSKINLSFTKNYHGVPGFKARVFEISACKSFLLTEYFDTYKKFLKEGQELIMFKDKKDLLNKIRYYLPKEKLRDSISKRAYEKVLSNYSQKREFEKIFKEIENAKNKPSEKFPNINEKVLTLTEKNLKLPSKELLGLVEKYDYVQFSERNSSFLKEKEFLQTLSLKLTNKPISCCDYYLHSNLIGDYLSIFSEHAYKVCKIEDFYKTLKLTQLLVKKDFFVKNLKYFRNFENNKPILFSKDNVAFVRSPLARLKKISDLDNEILGKISLPIFENNLRVIAKKKLPFLHLYLYKLILVSLFANKYLYYLLKKRGLTFLKANLKFLFRS